MAQYASIASLTFALALACAWPCSLVAQPVDTEQSMGNTILITIGDKVFAATLSDNATATAFKKLLPLSITMTELNGNEKLARLPGTMPRHRCHEPQPVPLCAETLQGIEQRSV